MSLTTGQATTIYLWLLENNLGTLADDKGNINPFAAQAGQRKKPSALPNPFWLKLPLGNPDKLMHCRLAWLGYFLRPVPCWVAA